MCIRDRTIPCTGEQCIEKPQVYMYGYVSIVSNFPVNTNYGSGVVGFSPFAIEGTDDYDNVVINIDSFDTITKPGFEDVETVSKKDVSIVRTSNNDYDFVLTKSLTGPQTIIVSFMIKSFKHNTLNNIHIQVVFIEISANDF